MKYILALDQGTTSSRAVLVDKEGAIRGIAQREFRQIFPSPSWVEHNPLEIWSSQASVITELLAHTGISVKEIAGIGITNQRETTVVWDRKTSEPIFNAIVWQDRRTTEYCRSLKNQGLEPLFKQKTGLLLDPYFSGTKLHWILTHVPGALEKAQRGELAFGTIDSWLVWKLTGGAKHITDVSNASRTLMFNITTGKWDEELLEILEIPPSVLPKVCSSSEIYGETSLPFFSTPLPICGIAGDQQAALFGQACFQKGMVKTTYGTGCFMLMNTGTEPVVSHNHLLTTVAYKINGKMIYALEGSVFMGGAVVQWLRDAVGIIKTSAEIKELARSVPSTEGVYFVPAFTGLGAPYWDPDVRGTIVGLTRGSTKAHIARAAIEAIAFQTTDVLKAMESDAGEGIKEVRVDGGASVDDLLMQFQANLLGVSVIRPEIIESTALGAAYLAGLALGFWKSEEELAAHWKAKTRFEPLIQPAEAQMLLERWQSAIACAKTWKHL